MYWRLVQVSAWESPLLHGETSKPHPHSIISALGCLDGIPEAGSTIELPMNTRSSPQAQSMGLGGSTPPVKTVHLASSNAGSRVDEQDQEESVQQIRDQLPTALISWPDLDLSFSLPEALHQKDNLPSSFQPSLLGGSVLPAVGSEHNPMQAFEVDSDAQDFTWPCGDGTYDFMFPAIDDIDIDLKRLNGTIPREFQPGPIQWSGEFKKLKSDCASIMPLQTPSRAYIA